MPERTLIVYHGLKHTSEYENAETLDVKHAATKPTYVGDLTNESLPVPQHVYNQVILHQCPYFVLFSNADQAFHALFRQLGDTIRWGTQNSVEQVVPMLDKEEEVIFDVIETQDGLIETQDVLVEYTKPGEEGWFQLGSQFYSNYRIEPIQLKPVSTSWLNLHSFVSKDGEVVMKAPMPRTYAAMHASTLSFEDTLRSLADLISMKTGARFMHKGVEIDESFSASMLVTPEGAPFYEYENYLWYLQPISGIVDIT